MVVLSEVFLFDIHALLVEQFAGSCDFPSQDFRVESVFGFCGLTENFLGEDVVNSRLGGSGAD